tara:strand:+ start:26 stop:700 length:675 start_codon:yes stop_codon:yes gene_type:complete
MKKYVIIAAAGKWNRDFFSNFSTNSYEFVLVQRPEELLSEINTSKPDFIFFIHWHWKVVDAVWKNNECIVFHMTDLPYGRGGSPLQNLILRGHINTKLSAFKMGKTFDSGPIFLKKDLSLSGRASEIYLRATILSTKMIDEIIFKEIKPSPQLGEVVIFKRRKPSDSKIDNFSSLDALFDYIRMLDAPGYPNAFIESENFRFSFSGSSMTNEILKARLSIERKT